MVQTHEQAEAGRGEEANSRRAVRNLQLSEIATSTVKVGEQGSRISYGLTTKATAVGWLFYRGTWCPYCNIELRAYQSPPPELRRRDASFVASSPEKPDFSEAFVTKKQIEYPVSDFRNGVARQFGLEFAVDEALQNLMKEFGDKLADKNGEDSWTLPSPEPSLSQAMGRIEYGFSAPDFTLRADPEGLLWTSCRTVGSLVSLRCSQFTLRRLVPPCQGAPLNSSARHRRCSVRR